MSHEILTVKLCQLDERMARLHSRIRMSETADRERLGREIADLRRECAQTDQMLQSDLRLSKAAVASVPGESYGQIQQTLAGTARRLAALETERLSAEAAVEDKILLSEYALDFAQRAADRALLLSLEAMDAQRSLEQKEGSLT